MTRSTKRSNSFKWIRFRIMVVGTVLGVCFGLVVGRAFQLQVLDGKQLHTKAAGQYEKISYNRPKRGTIYDRNYAELAVSIDVASVCAYPRQICSPENTASSLARVLNLEQEHLLQQLTSDKRFVWIKRHADPTEVSAVRALKLDGVDFVRESRRFYPLKGLASQVIGFCGMDGRGLEGLEFYYDAFLKGCKRSRTVLSDALGRGFMSEETSPEGEAGHNLILNIDKNVQYIAEQALAEGVKAFSAKSGIALVMVPRTGAILAMAHVPRFNPNIFAQYEPWLWRNRAIVDAFEPGSTFKIFLAAAALESGLCEPSSEFDCEGGAYRIGKNVVHDVSPHERLSLQDIVKYSSNIGAAKVGEKIGPAYLYHKLKEFGFGHRFGIDFPSETRGSLLPVGGWSEIDAGAICFGQGVSVSALQFGAAVCAIANDGLLMKPYLVQCMTDAQGRIVQRFGPTALRQVISPQNARCLTHMLERTVEKGGTGVRAALRDYRVAGKTGTAQKADPTGCGYAEDKYIASFVGFVPAENPEIVVLVVIDEPRKDYYGGVVAAPVFRRIAKETLRYLKIPPELVIPDSTEFGRDNSKQEAPQRAGGSFSASREAATMG
ncbi:MAG: penicillin-binding protein 2 [Deltaproteobacteria bacterium]|nr:MAG: penicillin-binding protein 2 [Deltaproteobacteria bacterium]